MRDFILQWLESFIPQKAAVDRFERMRASVGALFGILLTGLLSVSVLPHEAAVWLIAPMGASAVLLFAVPASPLAQPWSLIGGNLVAALVGVTCARLVAEPFLAAALAIALAVACMFALRCIHPPSGAVALTAVLGGPAVHAMGYGFVLAPVLLNSFLLLATALFFNNATGRRYPHAQQNEHRHNMHRTADAAPTTRLGFSHDDLDAVLRRYNQVLDISRDDLEEIFLQTEMEAYRRRFGETVCADIMSGDVVAAEFSTELAEAWRLMREHRLQALPVVDRARRVIGIVTKTDFLQHAGPHDYQHLGDKLRAFLQRTPHTHSIKPEVVGQIMSAKVRTASVYLPIVQLVPLMADEGVHQIPVIDDEKRLAGMVTQADMVAALYVNNLARASTGLRAVAS
ncbi:HPP family protein [Herbaspirillum rhizosphaerae]|uniref:HPP family protein n=1 Tax=Herbaspirillum rhizosphaerae TaxID=346179 RepID=UPI00067BE190|nr:HPP family protein [Herbaspirillum rhizosphaerae]